MDMKLNGRRALVTGASRGIGRAVARSLAAEGCALELTARNDEQLEALAKELHAASGVEVRWHVLDLARPDDQRALAERAGDVDLLVNNAGAVPGGELDEIGEDAWMAGWQLKVFGYINLTRHFYGRMKGAGRGVIVNVIGLAGERVNARTVALSSGNAALIALTRALGGRAPDFGVRVCGVNPGPTETERAVMLFRRQAEQRFGDPERWRELAAELPFGRPARPEEVAAAVTFLGSPCASYISGAVLNVDGGLGTRG